MRAFPRLSTAAAPSALIAAALFLLPFAQAEESALSTPTTGQTGAGSATSAMNPDLSLDGLFGLAQFSRDNPIVFDGGHDPKFTGFNLQQVELTLGSNVDPYFRADANLVLTTEGIEIEEAYATTLSLPWNLQAKGGQFFTAFGRNNPVHPHAWDFANKPLVLGRYFGGDGLRGTGAQLSWLAPLPWYAEVIASLQNSTGGNAISFNPSSKTTPTSQRTLGDGLTLLRLNNFFELTESLSLNVGASYAQGPNAQGAGNRTRILGGDVFFKFRKIEALSAITLQVEALQRTYDSAGGQLKDWGWYAQSDYRLPEGYERWHVGLRYDFVGPKNVPVNTTIALPDGTDQDTSTRFRISPVVTFYPSEFSKLRLQYDYDKPQSFDSAQHVAILQLEFAIGAHGAHKF
jgi:hypothetical protein